MEPVISSIFLFTIASSVTCLAALYEHNKIIEFVKEAERRQLKMEKIKKELTKGK
jgi:hypothetical protein